MKREDFTVLQALRSESGSAMVAVILVMGILTTIGILVAAVSFNNLENVGRDRIAGIAFGTSEGGVAQGVAHIGSAGLATLTCDDPPVVGTDCTNPWGSANPQVVTLAGGRQYSVWIQRIQKFTVENKQGVYRIHSTGTAGAGPAKRAIDLSLNVTPFKFPIGVYADQITDAGSPTLRKESMLSQSCITGREKITFEGTDPYHGIPSAAHSTEYITTKVNGACSATNKDNIHEPQPPLTNPGVCNTTYPNDQDRQGGDLTGTPCHNPLGYPQTSFFDLDALKAYGYEQPRGLTNAQYASLKSQAQEQGTYFTTTSFPTPANPPAYLNAVYYFNLKPGGGTVSIQNELNAFGGTTCGARSVVIVVEGGDMHVSAGSDIVGAVFVPDGNFRGNGSMTITGTLFARTIDKLNGSADFRLEQCFFDNFPGGLMELSTTRFREVDR